MSAAIRKVGNLMISLPPRSNGRYYIVEVVCKALSNVHRMSALGQKQSFFLRSRSAKNDWTIPENKRDKT
jgi:hypothetical protein